MTAVSPDAVEEQMRAMGTVHSYMIPSANRGSTKSMTRLEKEIAETKEMGRRKDAMLQRIEEVKDSEQQGVLYQRQNEVQQHPTSMYQERENLREARKKSESQSCCLLI